MRTIWGSSVVANGQPRCSLALLQLTGKHPAGDLIMLTQHEDKHVRHVNLGSFTAFHDHVACVM